MFTLIYIYICVCVCNCVYIYIYTYVYIYIHMYIEYREIAVMPGTFPENTRHAFTRLGITGVEMR